MLCYDRSDAPNSGEGRARDYAISGGTLSTNIQDIGNSATAYMCEIDLACKNGWTRYTDDGSEGKDSCLKVGSSTNSYATAAGACPALSHLFTFASSSRTGGIMQAALSLISTQKWYGCSQDAASTQRAAGWSWIDGTSAANLLCGNPNGASGCGAWGTGEPK